MRRRCGPPGRGRDACVEAGDIDAREAERSAPEADARAAFERADATPGAALAGAAAMAVDYDEGGGVGSAAGVRAEEREEERSQMREMRAYR